MHYPGTLFIVAAASGTGKTSLTTSLTSSLTNVELSISHTTRPLRTNEQQNKNYFFIDLPTFTKMIQNEEFLEYAEVFDHYYGTSKKWVLEKLAEGKDILLDIDWQGAQKIRQTMPHNTVSIFLLPPSRAELQKRLETRNRDSSDIISTRLAKASEEISHYREFDYLIVNDDFQQALANLQAIILASRLKCAKQAKQHKKLINNLLRF